jgi:hypothetical protein
MSKDINDVLLEMLTTRTVEAELDRRLKLAEALGKDTYEEGTVLQFQKQFKEEGRTYTYAALKCDGKWFLTGPRQVGVGKTWEEFLYFLLMDIPVAKFTVMVPQ